jgi:dienelactone hydrolase
MWRQLPKIGMMTSDVAESLPYAVAQTFPHLACGVRDEDKIVPPQQAETMFEALKAKNLPTTLIMYKGEQHGFRIAENIRHSLDSEYHFFCEVFGIDAQPDEEFGDKGVPIGTRVDR